MAATATTLTEKMRAALRISSTSEKITEEINDCIAACKMDLQDVGVKKLEETDALIIRAITLYCKAEFGYSAPFPRGRGLGLGIENLLIFLKINFFYKLY